MTKQQDNWEKRFRLLKNHLIILSQQQVEFIKQEEKKESQDCWQEQMDAIKSFISQTIKTEKAKSYQEGLNEGVKDGYAKFREIKKKTIKEAKLSLLGEVEINKKGYSLKDPDGLKNIRLGWNDAVDELNQKLSQLKSGIEKGQEK